MSSKRKLFLETSQFFWGEALIMLSGIISFPILTRVFSKEQYGIFSLIGVTITLLMTVSSLGVNRSLVRLYEKYKQKDQLSILLSTLFSVVCLFGVVFLVAAVMAGLLLGSFWDVVRYAFIPLILALIWMVLQNLFMLLNTPFRMEGMIFLYNLAGIIRKYGGLIVAITLVLLFNSLAAFYMGMVFIEGVIVSILLFFLIYKFRFYSSAQGIFSKKILRESISYGLPLALSSVPFIILNTGDRYIIAAFLGAEDVAVYSVSYNLCYYLKELLVSPLNLALVPLIFKFWEDGKKEEIRELLANIIRYFMMFAIPVCFLSVLISHDLITLLASEKYARSAQVVPFVLIGVFLQALDFPLSAGLHFAKKTTVILSIMIVAASVNIGLNLLLVPVYGIMGAAFATLISYVGYSLAFYLISRKYFAFKVHYSKIAQYAVFSLICFLCASWYSSFFHIQSQLINIVNTTFAFFSVYLLLLFFIDKEIKVPIQRVISLFQGD